MTLVDWVIVIVLVASLVGGLKQGFFRAVFGLGGLFLGLALAAWNYPRVASFFVPLAGFGPVADAIGFLLIAMLVMSLAGILGAIIAKALHQVGLGCLDTLAGGAFGLLQGALFVMLCVLVAVAFFPQAKWLSQSQLPRQFFGACHLSTHVSPGELAERVRQGLHRLEERTPEWLHPGNAGS